MTRAAGAVLVACKHFIRSRSSHLGVSAAKLIHFSEQSVFNFVLKMDVKQSSVGRPPRSMNVSSNQNYSQAEIAPVIPKNLKSLINKIELPTTKLVNEKLLEPTSITISKKKGRKYVPGRQPFDVKYSSDSKNESNTSPAKSLHGSISSSVSYGQADGGTLLKSKVEKVRSSLSDQSGSSRSRHQHKHQNYSASPDVLKGSCKSSGETYSRSVITRKCQRNLSSELVTRTQTPNKFPSSTTAQEKSDSERSNVSYSGTQDIQIFETDLVSLSTRSSKVKSISLGKSAQSGQKSDNRHHLHKHDKMHPSIHKQPRAQYSQASDFDLNSQTRSTLQKTIRHGNSWNEEYGLSGPRSHESKMKACSQTPAPKSDRLNLGSKREDMNNYSNNCKIEVSISKEIQKQSNTDLRIRKKRNKRKHSKEDKAELGASSVTECKDNIQTVDQDMEGNSNLEFNKKGVFSQPFQRSDKDGNRTTESEPCMQKSKSFMRKMQDYSYILESKQNFLESTAGVNNNKNKLTQLAPSQEADRRADPLLTLKILKENKRSSPSSDMSISSVESGQGGTIQCLEYDNNMRLEPEWMRSVEYSAGQSSSCNISTHLNPLASTFVPQNSAHSASWGTWRQQNSFQPHSSAALNMPPSLGIQRHHLSSSAGAFGFQSLIRPASGLGNSANFPGGTYFNQGQMVREYSQNSGRSFHLNLDSASTCPEQRWTPRVWQVVKQAEVKQGELEFTCMSYNILSQDLLEAHTFLYKGCQEADLEWTNRGPALLTQIIAHNADIVCLQEVNQDHWCRDIKRTLAEHGYMGVYKKKTGDPQDGSAILYKTNKFKSLKVVPVEFMKGGILDRNNVGLILLLQPLQEVYSGSVQKICIATTHLLFNPRRGDVKLAQLVLFLAEIDKHAYLENDSTESQGGKFPKGVEELESDANLKGHGKEQDAFLRGNSASLSGRPPRGHRSRKYCPIILCGDFNSEPFCDLYRFITTGFLKYDNLIARFVCGQKEGMHSGSNQLVERRLLPEHLEVAETCQYMQVLQSRQAQERAALETQQQPRVNSGQIFHSMNFHSVYSHDMNKKNLKEITTHHNRCSCTVDYIFYSQNAGAPFGKQLQKNSQPVSNNQAALDSTIESNNITQSVSSVTTETLELVARYRLMTQKEVARYRFLPNSVLPSDHLCLIAKFVLHK